MLLSASTAILEVVVVAVVPISSMVVHWVVMLNMSTKLTGSSPGIP